MNAGGELCARVAEFAAAVADDAGIEEGACADLSQGEVRDAAGQVGGGEPVAVPDGRGAFAAVLVVADAAKNEVVVALDAQDV